ncbi:hypothetical protein SCHPADRAFT_881937 [Schizopora paradoxa]|uniref:Zn(2)-C6 fungal-type domain-containing protein n=1 Tax=Schizopora paradoxa TaxID=27342 RepID=A0A0H2RQZ0_9AGAM|nr:hypothetical protein SCHPADRAFT_881937 [Schizopora paradoxa]
MKDNNDQDGSAQKTRKKPGRAPVSCAECRRLKMKCDRRHPCENCTRRGCAAICPDGTLATGKGNRMVLANTEELHERIEILCGRIRALEDALKILQASVSTEPHPLLVANEVTPPEASTSSIPTIPTTIARPVVSNRDDDEEISLDAFGTLAIGSDGETNFLGHTARSDYLLQESDYEDENITGRLPKEFQKYSWPEAPQPTMILDEEVLGYLPQLNEAYELCNIYLDRSKWLGPFITHDHLYHDLIAHVYHLPNYPWADSDYTCSHRLSLVYMVFALGILLDPARPPYSVEAEDYYRLARAALSYKSAVLETTINAVLSIMHMAQYLELCDTQHGYMQGWVMLGIAAKLAFSMGLDRDSSRWKLDDEVSQRRHATFWQLYRMELMASLHLGRPPLLSEVFIDCPLPRDYFADRDNRNPPQELSYHIWTIQFTRLACYISEEAFGVKSHSYSAILALDRKIREFAQPDWLSFSIDAEMEEPAVKLQRWSAIHLRETVTLQLHRGYLVQALSERPQDLLRSKFKSSVQACYDSALRIIDGLQWVHGQVPSTTERIGSWFGSAVTSAIVLCLLVTRCPTTELSPTAMAKVELICNIVESASGKNRVVSRNLEATKKLRRQARSIFNASRSHSAAPQVIVTDEDNKELERLGGKTRLLARRSKTPSIRSGYSTDRQMGDEGWGTRPSGRSASSDDSNGWSSPGRGSEGPRTPSYHYIGYPPQNMQAQLDPTWHSFIEQLGFGVP